jgi:hypothetical protein
MEGSSYSQECLGTCTSLTKPAKVSMMKETRPFSLQENVVFPHTKSCGSWHMCEVNFEVSSITMHNMWYLLCLILYIKMKIWHYVMAHVSEFFFKFSFLVSFFPQKGNLWYNSVFPLYFPQNGKNGHKKQYAKATMHRHFGTISKWWYEDGLLWLRFF